MKRILIILLTVLCIISLVACGSKEVASENIENVQESVKTDDNASTDESKVKETITVEVIPKPAEATAEPQPTLAPTEKPATELTLGLPLESTSEPTSEPTQEPIKTTTSKFEKAYIRELGEYSLYLMFDEDEKDVIGFGTNDTYVMKGSYKGSFSSGVTISWDDGWDESFTHVSGSTATLIDGSGFDWDYKVFDVQKTQELLDDLQQEREISEKPIQQIPEKIIFTGGVCSHLVSFGDGTPPDNKTEFIEGEEVCFTGRFSGFSGEYSVTFIATFPDGTMQMDNFKAMSNDVIGYGWIDVGVGTGNFKVILDSTGETLAYYEFTIR